MGSICHLSELYVCETRVGGSEGKGLTSEQTRSAMEHIRATITKFNPNYTDHYLVVKVSGDEFKIELDAENIRRSGSFKFDIVVPYSGDLKRISTSGSSDIDVEGKSKTLNIRTSGSSDVVANVISSSCEVTTSGSSDAVLKGKTGSVHARASGASDISIRDLEYENISISKSGSADVR